MTKREKYKKIIETMCGKTLPEDRSLPERLGWCFMSTELYVDMIKIYNGILFNDNVSILSMEHHDDNIIEFLIYGNDFRPVREDEDIPKYTCSVDKYITEVHSKHGSEVVDTNFTCVWVEETKQ